MKSTEKLNPFVFDEDIAGQSNSFVQTFTVRDRRQNQGYAVEAIRNPSDFRFFNHLKFLDKRTTNK